MNVFLDISAVVAITTGPPITSLLKTKPYKQTDKIVNHEMIIEVLYLAFY
jgi:hypothetical protein